MKRTGEILKKEREARGLSLHEIGLSLKINSKILRAIEDGDSTQLPAKTFLRGFVQSYASYLKLNVDDVLKVFADEMGTTRPQSPILINEPTKEVPRETAREIMKDSKTSPIVIPAPAPVALKHQGQNLKKEKKTSLEESSTTKGLVFSLLGVILAGLILLTMKVIDRYQKEAQVAAIDVKPIEEERAPISSGKVTDDKAAVSTPVMTPAVAPVPAPAKPVTVSPPPITTPALTPVITPKPMPIVAVTPKPVEPVKIEPKPVAPMKETPKETKPIELIVEALDNVEIEYAAGAGKVEKIKLEPEQIHTFKSKAGLKLNINNGGAVNMILNGKDLGVPGDLGKSIKLTY